MLTLAWRLLRLVLDLVLFPARLVSMHYFGSVRIVYRFRFNRSKGGKPSVVVGVE